jgi:chromosome segregation protein
VRQGQISELIAAKPQNRRRILEEAAGVSGLYSRRQEAELRVRGAETNLERLADLATELESNLGRLRREARAAAKYKAVAAEIRTLRGALLRARWSEAANAEAQALQEAREAARVVETSALTAAAASARAVEAQTAIAPHRDEEMAAAAVLSHLAIERDRLDRALEAAAGELARITNDIARIAMDQEREVQIGADAESARARLAADLAAVDAEIAAAPERIPALEAAYQVADSARAEAEAAVEALATEVAAAQAETRAAGVRLSEALSRRQRAEDLLSQAKAERVAVATVDDDGLAEALAAAVEAEAALVRAHASLEQAETAGGEAARLEQAARARLRAAEDELAGATVEARALARLNPTSGEGQFPPALEQLAPSAGLEAALAAALGDDAIAALDSRAATFWGGRPSAILGPDWPDGVTPISPLIVGPPQLAARLAFTGLVDRDLGPRLQGRLPPGARLVSREGDLWRWDGFTTTRDAPSPAQARLLQKRRLATLEAQIETLSPLAAEALAGHAAAAAALAAAEQAARIARAGPREAEQTLSRARERAEALGREAARRDARVASLDETILRLEGDVEEAAAAVEEARAAATAPAGDPDLADRLAAARQNAVALREPAAGARAALDMEVHGRNARARRREALAAELAEWGRRAQAAVGRQATLAKDLEKARLAQQASQDAPGRVEERRLRLLDEIAVAESRKRNAGDALTAMETARMDADRAVRAAEAIAADARASRAGADARLEAARDRLADALAALAEAGVESPEPDEAPAPSVAGSLATEARLAALEADRAALGAVNLRAEEEVEELTQRLEQMAAERADLTGALSRLRQAIAELNAEGRERLTVAFEIIDGHFRTLFTSLFQGGAAELRLVESDDPLEAGLEILACPPGKRMAVMSLMSGGEQALTAVALIFAVFLANPAPVCVLDEVDAPLDDANVERFCNLLAEMRARASTRFITITHNPLTMSRMDRLFGVTMRERGVSQLVSVDLKQAADLAAQ